MSNCSDSFFYFSSLFKLLIHSWVTQPKYHTIEKTTHKDNVFLLLIYKTSHTPSCSVGECPLAKVPLRQERPRLGSSRPKHQLFLAISLFLIVCLLFIFYPPCCLRLERQAASSIRWLFRYPFICLLVFFYHLALVCPCWNFEYYYQQVCVNFCFLFAITFLLSTWFIFCLPLYVKHPNGNIYDTYFVIQIVNAKRWSRKFVVFLKRIRNACPKGNTNEIAGCMWTHKIEWPTTRWPRQHKQQPCLNSVARFKQCSTV